MQRGRRRVAELIDRTPGRFLSVFSLLELLQGAQNKRQQRLGQSFLRDLNFRVLPLTGLLQLAASSFRTIKYWSGLAGDFGSPTRKCSAKNINLLTFV
ncbi:MAG: hypothetical protein WB586_31035, partial [Chthoniobacterales bacterium]